MAKLFNQNDSNELLVPVRTYVTTKTRDFLQRAAAAEGSSFSAWSASTLVREAEKTLARKEGK